MSHAERASRIVGKVAADLAAMLQDDRGPDPHQLIVGQLYDAAGQLMQAAADIEEGAET